MDEIILESDAPERTRQIARAMGELLTPGDHVALVGPLGAGKTCLTQGLLEGLGCETHARSPSYVLVHEHQGRTTVYHCDWYRLESDEDLDSTGFDDLLGQDSVVIVEWADRFAHRLPTPRLWIEIEIQAANRRRLRARCLPPEGFKTLRARLASL